MLWHPRRFSLSEFRLTGGATLFVYASAVCLEDGTKLPESRSGRAIRRIREEQGISQGSN